MSEGTIDMKRKKKRLSRNIVEPASRLMKAMSNRHRLETLLLLSQGEYSVGELRVEIGLSNSGFSQHLAILRREGLVRTRREAQKIYYSLAAPGVEELLARVLYILDASGSIDRLKLGIPPVL